MSAIYAVALKEFQDCLRNRWFVSITIIFAILSVGLSYYGSVASGSIGLVSLSSTIASLSSLAVFIIPLIALLLSYDSFVGEQEAGTLLLLLTYPISRNQLLLGKFCGQGCIIALATFIGFGAAGILLYTQNSAFDILASFGLFIFSAILLGWCFMSIAYVISLMVSEKSKAAGIALIVWFLFVLVFDLALLALLIGVTQGLDQQSLITMMLFNPTDLFRLINLSQLDTSDVNGVLSVAINGSWAMPNLLGVMIAWIVVPMGLASWLLKRKTL